MVGRGGLQHGADAYAWAQARSADIAVTACEGFTLKQTKSGWRAVEKSETVFYIANTGSNFKMLLKDEKNDGESKGHTTQIRWLKPVQAQLDWSNVSAGQQGRGEGGHLCFGMVRNNRAECACILRHIHTLFWISAAFDIFCHLIWDTTVTNLSFVFTELLINVFISLCNKLVDSKLNVKFL